MRAAKPSASEDSGNEKQSQDIVSCLPSEMQVPPASVLEGASRYAIAQKLGEGTFASVHQVTDLQTGKKRALKTVEKTLCTKYRGLEVAVEMEVSLMRQLGRHPNIVGLVDSFETPSYWGLVLELATGGQVFDQLVEGPCAAVRTATPPGPMRSDALTLRGRYGESDASELVQQVARALLHVHSANVCHRDVKPENLVRARGAGNRPHDLSAHDSTPAAPPTPPLRCQVLHTASPGSDVRLCDFGVSLPCGGEHGPLRGCRGTMAYMAPEMLNGQEYGTPVDMWALGVVLYSLLSGSHPFDPFGVLSEKVVEERIHAFTPELFDECDVTGEDWQVRLARRQRPYFPHSQLRASRPPRVRVVTADVSHAPQAYACPGVPCRRSTSRPRPRRRSRASCSPTPPRGLPRSSCSRRPGSEGSPVRACSQARSSVSLLSMRRGPPGERRSSVSSLRAAAAILS